LLCRLPIRDAGDDPDNSNQSTVPQTPDPDLGSRILKVNHAGENGAVNIYRGQILSAGLTARSMVAELREFKAHEERTARFLPPNCSAAAGRAAAATCCAASAAWRWA